MVKSFWFGRFTVSEDADYYYFVDSLILGQKALKKSLFQGLSGIKLDLAFFAWGFLPICIKSTEKAIGDSPNDPSDLLFWQFPARTEAQAFEAHQKLPDLRSLDAPFHCYLGLPWATFIDKKTFPEDLLASLKVRLSGLALALKELGVELKIHTVCQHVYWKTSLPVWKSLGVTDLWLSHHQAYEQKGLELTLHPWALYAVNIEDPNRRVGLQFDIAPSEKRYLASFIGTHADHYLKDSRLKLMQLKNDPNFYIQMQDQWHFERVVYEHQVAGVGLQDVYQADEQVGLYNEVLSQSKFALCPSGAGPNTIRLWEALALGVTPVLLGVNPSMPLGGSLESINWDSLVVQIPDEDIADLPNILGKIDYIELKQRGQLAKDAYAKVKTMTCFH